MNQVTNRSSQEEEGPPVVSSRLGVLGRASALALLGKVLIYPRDAQRVRLSVIEALPNF